MRLKAFIGDECVDVSIVEEPEGRAEVIIDGETLIVDVREVRPGVYSLLVEGRSFEVMVREENDAGRGPLSVSVYDDEISMEFLDARVAALSGRKAIPGGDVQRLTAPMHGKVVRVLVVPGERVEAGQGLLVMEAMKMENELKAASAGVVSALRVAVGDSVDRGAELCSVHPE